MSMLPDEILLDLINDQLPGREIQIRTLATLINVTLPDMSSYSC